MSNVRYRCDNCGNVTRFDVTETRMTKSYYHYTIGGELSVETVEVLESKVVEVSCRWCSSSKSVVEIDV